MPSRDLNPRAVGYINLAPAEISLLDGGSTHLLRCHLWVGGENRFVVKHGLLSVHYSLKDFIGTNHGSFKSHVDAWRWST
jgi:hypothetical protein